MELDTGASVSVLSNTTYLDLQRQGHTLPLQPSPVKVKLESYTGDTIPVVGCTTVQARYSNCKQVPVVVQVVSGDGPNLLGRDWLGQLEVDLGAIQVNALRLNYILIQKYILNSTSLVQFYSCYGTWWKVNF